MHGTEPTAERIALALATLEIVERGTEGQQVNSGQASTVRSALRDILDEAKSKVSG